MRPAIRHLAPLLALTLALQGCHDAGTSDQSAAAQTPPSAASVARGRYLAAAADCASCHSAAGQGEYAGGYAVATPYGPIYGPNITPDKKTGIGNYTRDDLYRVLHDGRLPDGRPLYPAMPYTSYRLLSRADSDAIYDYLMSRPSIHRANTPPGLRFPYNLRFAMYGWQALFMPDAKAATPPAGADPQLTRGAYLANALGHCTECHTPRTFTGALDTAATFKGAMIGRYQAPDITPAALAARGWTTAGLQQLLASGIAPQGSAFGDMFPAVHNSTRYLSRQDIASLVRYLGGPAGLPPPAPVTPAALPADVIHRGQSGYANLCAGCHGAQGEGKPHVAPALQGNSSLRLASPNNLLVAIIDGVDEQGFSQLEHMQAMPGVPGFVTDQDVADLVNTLRTQWGGQPSQVSAADVAGLRNSHAP